MSDSSSSLDSQENSMVYTEIDKDSSNYDSEYNANCRKQSFDEPVSVSHYSPYEQYTDIVRYTPQILTLLEPYRPESTSISPPMYTKMNPLPYTERLELYDDAAVVPSSVLPAEERISQDGSSSPVEDYKNLAIITPTLFEIKKEKQVFFSEDMESVASSSSPASSASHGSWLQSTQIDDSGYEIVTNSPTGMAKDFSNAPNVWECVNCAAVSSSTDVWWPDETGHFLCGSCSKTRSFYTAAAHPNKSPKNKSLKDENEQIIMSKLNLIPPRFHHRVNGFKKVNQICSNCQTSSTSLWRRSAFGETVCNACGLYYKLHKRNRPITMRKDAIQKRKRKPKTPSGKKFLTHTLQSKFEDDEMNSSISSNPPSYTSHLAMLNETPDDADSSGTLPTYTTIGQPLPSVHSPDGFSSQLSHYNSMPITSRSSPLMEAYNSNYIPMPNSRYSSYGSISLNTSPTITSLLQSSHSYAPFGDHSSYNHSTNLQQPVYNL